MDMYILRTIQSGNIVFATDTPWKSKGETERCCDPPSPWTPGSVASQPQAHLRRENAIFWGLARTGLQKGPFHQNGADVCLLRPMGHGEVEDASNAARKCRR